jgi:prevent-host-death family protein
MEAHMTTWQATKAKAQLSAVMDRAASEGPQRLTRRGRGTFILVTEEEWKNHTKPKESLGDFLRRSPLRGSGIKIERIKGGLRDIEF